MKKIQIITPVFAVALLLLLASCKKSFIDIDPKGQFLTENYYKTQDQAYGALIGVYDVMRKNAGGFENMVCMMNAGSDDQLAGGGHSHDGDGIQNFSTHSLTAGLIPESFWNDYYQCIFRANTLLSKIDGTDIDATLKSRIVAETKALRAYSYFDLLRMFRNIPLLLEPLTATNMYEVEQVAPEDVYTQIEKDLTEAIADLPVTLSSPAEYGRFTKVAAEALLGKVLLYEGKGGPAATMLADVNGPTPGQPNQYGNHLLEHFSDLWIVDNKFNAESILESVHTQESNADWTFWGSGADEGNSVNQMVGPRSYSKKKPAAPDIPSGWSFNVFTQKFYDLIKTNPRFDATVFDMEALKAAGDADYIGGYLNTGYFLNKFLPRTADIHTGGGVQELNFHQDMYVIRLADTYLLEAEALGATGSRAQALLDAVRARVGLPSVPVSLAAIKAERRMELAGEGHRFFDLVRWGDAAAALNDRGFNAGTDEIFPIPARELRGTKLKQNPNYN